MAMIPKHAVLNEIIGAFTAALDAQNASTRGHSDRVADIAGDIAMQLGLTDEEQEIIHIAGHLHDIGKIGIADRVLMKPGQLT